MSADPHPPLQRDNLTLATLFGAPEEMAAEVGGRMVVSFGEPPSGLPPERLLRADQGGNPVEAVAGLDPGRLVNGLAFAFGPGWRATDLETIREAQRRLLYSFYNYVYCPAISPINPDPYGVRGEQDQLPELVRMISVLENTPYLLRYPVVDKLAALKLGLPVLVLLPGPSLPELAPHLPELARRCLVVCVSRAVAWCLEQGVEPDFVVQLDTFLVQQHIYAHIPPLPRTTLVPISIAPIRRYGHKFRGCFFMDSFNQGVLPNPHRLRESHLSSLLACLGLAECLHAPRAFLVGADLSMPAEAETYFHSGGGWTGADAAGEDGPLVVDSDRFIMTDAAGNRVHTLLRYLATAQEAADFARDIEASAGTRFFNLSGRGILPARWYPAATTDEVMALPELDREGFLSRVDKGLGQSEPVNLIKYKVELLKTLDIAREAETFLFHCLRTGQVEEAFRHPLARFMLRERDYFLYRKKERDEDKDRGVLLDAALRLVRVWARQLTRAKGFVQARMLLGRGRDLNVLCLPGEEELIARRLDRLMPGGALAFVHLGHHVESGPAGQAREVSFFNFRGWLEQRDLVLVSQAMRREFDYFFDVRPEDKLLVLERILDDPEA